MKLRSIKLRGKGKGLKLNVTKVEETHIMDNFGNLLPKVTELFGKDPRGNWQFSDTGKGYCEYVLKETEDWANKTPATAPDSILQMNPNIIKKYGPNVPYVSLEEALMALLKQMKSYLRTRDFWVVCDKDTKDVVRFLVDKGWPKRAVENLDLAYTGVEPEQSTPSSSLIEEQIKAEEPAPTPKKEETVVFDTDEIKKMAKEVETPVKKPGRPKKKKEQKVEVSIK